MIMCGERDEIVSQPMFKCWLLNMHKIINYLIQIKDILIIRTSGMDFYRRDKLHVYLNLFLLSYI